MYEVTKTPRIERKLKAILGDKADLSKIKVYETLSNDSRPILGAGVPWKDSRMSRSYLDGMAMMLQSGQYVPLIHHHKDYNDHAEGRLFDAAVFTAADGADELHALFYILDNEENTTLNSKINSGIINEVSTQTTPGSLKCSSCDFDFLASKDNRAKLYAGKDYTPLCDNGHQWGIGGNHLILDGAPRAFKEQSLVLRGAVKGARVLKLSEQKLSLEQDLNLAASESNDTLTLNTSIENSDQPFPKGQFSDDGHSGSNTMTDITIPRSEYDQLVLAKGKADSLEVQLATATEALAAAGTAKQTAEVNAVELTTAKADLEVKLQEAEAAKVAAETQLALASNQGGDAKEHKLNTDVSLNLGSLDASFYTKA